MNNDLRSENARSLDLADLGDPTGDIAEGVFPGEIGEAKRTDLDGLPALALGPPIATLVSTDRFGAVGALLTFLSFSQLCAFSSEFVGSVSSSISLAMPALSSMADSLQVGTELEAAMGPTTTLLSRKSCAP